MNPEMVWKVDVPDCEEHGYVQAEMNGDGIHLDLFDDMGENIGAWQMTPQDMVATMLGIGRKGDGL